MPSGACGFFESVPPSAWGGLLYLLSMVVLVVLVRAVGDWYFHRPRKPDPPIRRKRRR